MMRAFLLIAVAITTIALAASARAEEDWALADSIVRGLQKPVIPRRDFSIAKFGANPGASDSLPAIRAAIDAAVSNGGGRVTVPRGTWVSRGPVHLRSNIELHLDKGATLVFDREARYYLPLVPTRWEGVELLGYSPLIYANDVHDVAITGPGVIDGNENSEFHGWSDKQKNDQRKLRKQGTDAVPVAERRYAEGTFLRPSAIQFFRATRVLLDGYTLRNSPFWMNHLVYTDHAMIRNLTLDSRHANNDGVDVDSSRNIVIEHNVFHTGDDAIAIKSGRDRDGRDIARPSENIVIRLNDMGDEDGIGLGSEMSAGIRNVFIDKNRMRGGASAFRFKANEDRGGMVEHVRVRNIRVGWFKTLIWFQLDYPVDFGGGHPALYRDIVFENVWADRVGKAFEIHAPESAPLRNVRFKNIRVSHADQTANVEGAEQLQFEHITVGGRSVDADLNGGGHSR